MLFYWGQKLCFYILKMFGQCGFEWDKEGLAFVFKW